MWCCNAIGMEVRTQRRRRRRAADGVPGHGPLQRQGDVWLRARDGILGGMVYAEEFQVNVLVPSGYPAMSPVVMTVAGNRRRQSAYLTFQ